MRQKILIGITSIVLLGCILIPLFLGGWTFKAIYNYNTTPTISEYEQYGINHKEYKYDEASFGNLTVDGIVFGTIGSIIVFGGSLLITYPLLTFLIFVPSFYLLDCEGWNKHQKEMKKRQEKIDQKNKQKQLKLALIEKRLEEARRCKNPDMEKIRQLLIQQNSNLAQQTNVVEQMYPWVVIGALGAASRD